MRFLPIRRPVKLGDDVQRPRYFGLLTNDIVYDRLAPGVLDELKKIEPKERVRTKNYKVLPVADKKYRLPEIAGASWSGHRDHENEFRLVRLQNEVGQTLSEVSVVR